MAVAARPMLDVRAFALRGFRTGTLAITVQFLCLFGFFLVGLQFLQLLMGYSPLLSAVSLLPMAMIVLPLSRLSPHLVERFGARSVMTAGLASLGGARDRSLGFDGEIYTLYVDPSFFGQGAGRKLLHGAFAAMKERKFHSCLIWSHARNNACFFYEAMGGQRVAERTTRLGGEPTPEVAFGWKRLATNSRRLAI